MLERRRRGGLNLILVTTGKFAKSKSSVYVPQRKYVLLQEVDIGRAIENSLITLRLI